jgi:hypothetical protein
MGRVLVPEWENFIRPRVPREHASINYIMLSLINSVDLENTRYHVLEEALRVSTLRDFFHVADVVRAIAPKRALACLCIR